MKFNATQITLFVALVALWLLDWVIPVPISTTIIIVAALWKPFREWFIDVLKKCSSLDEVVDKVRDEVKK